MTTAEIKSLLNMNVRLRYGKSAVLIGRLNDLTPERVHVKNEQGNYGVPLDQIVGIMPLADPDDPRAVHLT